MITWPQTLPLPTIEGYSIQPSDAILRTEMEAGPVRQRRRVTQVPSRVSVRWIMCRDQFALFEAWYHWKAKEGGAWFEIELLGGLGLLMQEARFTQQFQAQLLAGLKHYGKFAANSKFASTPCLMRAYWTYCASKMRRG
ncbi:hypothetical protein [Bartonella rattaustraliani]|uniref:hypothetical protein n=1 Tax=Bartonella rattaustraliani TaxID=481139 RepID=UPI0002E1A2C6|nr:hypothetical protein [Bartonella rattaustraliani]